MANLTFHSRKSPAKTLPNAKENHNGDREGVIYAGTAGCLYWHSAGEVCALGVCTASSPNSLASLPALGDLRQALVKVVRFSVANVGDRIGNMTPGMVGLLPCELRKHLHSKPAVEAVSNLSSPRAPYDLCGHAPGRTRLGHDVVGNLPGPL